MISLSPHLRVRPTVLLFRFYNNVSLAGRKLRTNGNLDKLEIGTFDKDSEYNFEDFDIDDQIYDNFGRPIH